MIQRVNLFKHLTKNKPTSAFYSKSRLLYVSCIAVLVLILFVDWLSFVSRKRVLRQSLSQSQTQLNQMIESQFNRRLSESDPGGTLSPEYSNTWTLLMWQLAALTEPNVVLKKIEATNLDGSNKSGSRSQRKIIIEGRAHSISALREWARVLISRVPGFDFAIDQQRQTKEPDFSVEFKLTGLNL